MYRAFGLADNNMQDCTNVDSFYICGNIGQQRNKIREVVRV